MVDVVITVMIIGILAAVATPRFVDALSFHRADAAAKRIKADLQWSRQHAMSSSAAVLIQFDTASNSYTIPAISDPDHAGQTYTVDLTQYPYCSTLVSAACGGDSDLSLSRYGQPDSTAVITVQSGKYTQTVTVNAATGGVSIP